MVGMATLKLSNHLIIIGLKDFKIFDSLFNRVQHQSFNLDKGDEFVNVFDSHFYTRQIYAIQRKKDTVVDFYSFSDSAFF